MPFLTVKRSSRLNDSRFERATHSPLSAIMQRESNTSEPLSQPERLVKRTGHFNDRLRALTLSSLLSAESSSKRAASGIMRSSIS